MAGLTPEEVRAIVRQELRALLAPLAGEAPQQDEWVNAQEAAQRLGMPSPALYQGITSGLFRIGKEVRDRRLPGRKKPNWQFNLASCQQRLNQPPEKRKVV